MEWISGYKTQYGAPAGETGILWKASGKRLREGGRISVDKRRKHGKMGQKGKDGHLHVSRQLVSRFSGWVVPGHCGLPHLLIKLY